jgi:hypothetical protein
VVSFTGGFGVVVSVFMGMESVGGGAGFGFGAAITSAFPASAGGDEGGTFSVPLLAFAAPVFRACAALTWFGELLSPVYFRLGSRKIASTTLSWESVTTSFMPHVFSHPFL